jgi:hypothetical protein
MSSSSNKNSLHPPTLQHGSTIHAVDPSRLNSHAAIVTQVITDTPPSLIPTDTRCVGRVGGWGILTETDSSGLRVIPAVKDNVENSIGLTSHNEFAETIVCVCVGGGDRVSSERVCVGVSVGWWKGRLTHSPRGCSLTHPDHKSPKLF